MRSKKALLNTVVQIILEFVTVLSGFIVPRLIIKSFGSDANGLVVSISQFFGYLTLLQSGIGGVAKAALYKPLADNNNKEINSLVKAIDQFFKKIGLFSICYLLVLMVIFPTVIYPNGSAANTAVLVLIIWVGIFFQYYFGMTYQFLLQADQRYYIYSITQICVVIINTILSVVLIQLGLSLPIVKLSSAIVFVVRPILLSIYCKRKYNLKKHVKPDNQLIKQRWDGFGHTIAYFIHSKTDVFILTIFTTLLSVSVYSVYASIATGLSLLLNTIATSVQSAFGNMIARNEKENLVKNFHAYVCVNNILILVMFSTGIISIIPFMRIYTRGFTENEYINPLFAVLILIAEATYCIRMPYQTVVLAAGHYKQTRNGAFAEAFANIFVSLVLVNKWGLVGVAIGTLIAMVFRTIQYIIYLSNNITSQRVNKEIVFLIVDGIILLITSVISNYMNKLSIVLGIDNYIKWALYACIVFCLEFSIICPLIAFIDRKSFIDVVYTVRGIIKRKA